MNPIGKQAEDQATEYLQRKGYKIYYRNYRFGRFEVDIVCEYHGQIIIVEVKSLTSIRIRKPYESVSKRKQRRIVKVADHLLNEHFSDSECRFDIISILFKKEEVKIVHITDAFVPEITISN
tara:strand:+ start:9830 stop:10195 length:366 start_codon:yes stop_codon:yes gene_type:complete